MASASSCRSTPSRSKVGVSPADRTTPGWKSVASSTNVKPPIPARMVISVILDLWLAAFNPETPVGIVSTRLNNTLMTDQSTWVA